MKEFSISLRGPLHLTSELLLALQVIDGLKTVEIKSQEPVRQGLLDRNPLRQIELVDVIIGFAVNIASNMTYDMVKAAIKERAKENGYKEKETDMPRSKEKN
jgi:uncharacterized metal-binding protein